MVTIIAICTPCESSSDVNTETWPANAHVMVRRSTTSGNLCRPQKSEKSLRSLNCCSLQRIVNISNSSSCTNGVGEQNPVVTSSAWIHKSPTRSWSSDRKFSEKSLFVSDPKEQSNGLQPTRDGLQPTSDGLQPTSKGNKLTNHYS